MAGWRDQGSELEKIFAPKSSKGDFDHISYFILLHIFNFTTLFSFFTLKVMLIVPRWRGKRIDQNEISSGGGLRFTIHFLLNPIFKKIIYCI